LVLAGNGADELFAGYEKYATRVRDAQKRMMEDLERSLEEAKRIAIFANSLGKEVRFPFLDKDIVAAGQAIPLEKKISGSGRKVILRDTAGLLGLHAADRPKKAAQYSSGILRMMQTLAKGNHESLSEWTQNAINEQHPSKD